MEGIPMAKRVEVARYYILGYPYTQIEEKTGVSHGAVVNVIKELEIKKLSIPGLPSDQVNVLHQLSFDLKKKGLEPSQALLGITFFERLKELGITPADIGHWSELMKASAPADFPAKDFFEAAVKLRHLEETTGKPFSDLVEEYLTLEEKTDALNAKTESLSKTKAELSHEMESLSAQVNGLKKERDQLKGNVEIQSAKLQEVKTAVAEAIGERSQLIKEVKELKQQKAKLSPEVDGKEESLIKLKDIGLSDEDLLRLCNLLEKMGKKQGTGVDHVKKEFFSAFACFSDLSELKEAMNTEVKTIKEFVNQKSLLAGEIAELEKTKAVLQGEMSVCVSAASKQMSAASEEAVSLIQQEAAAITKEIRSLLEDALVTGEAVGEMVAVQKKSEDSTKELTNILNELKGRSGGH